MVEVLGTQGSSSHNFKQGSYKIDYNLISEEKALELALRCRS